MQSYSGGVSNTHSKKILVHKITASPWEQVLASCHTDTRATFPIYTHTCKLKYCSLQPGFELLLCWVTVSAGGELYYSCMQGKMLVFTRPFQKDASMCLSKEVTIKVNHCVSEQQGWERAALGSKKQGLPTGPGGLTGHGGETTHPT